MRSLEGRDMYADVSSPLVRRKNKALSDWREHVLPVPSPQNLTLGELAQRWLKRETEQKKRRSLRDARSVVNGPVFAAIGGLPAHELITQHVQAWLAVQLEADYAPRTVRRHASYLSVICQYGVELGACARNVVRDLPPNSLPPAKNRDPHRSRMEVLELAQVARILRGPGPVWRRLFFGLLLLTGTRFGEAAALRWCDLTSNHPLDELVVARSWACREHEFRSTKTGVPRRVPVHPRLRDLITEARAYWPRTFGRDPEPDDLLIPSPSGVWFPHAPSPWHESSTLVWWHDYLDELGIAHPALAKRRLHSTRHTFISHLARAGTPLELVQVLTHAEHDRRAFATYVHWQWPDLCDAVMNLRIPEVRP